MKKFILYILTAGLCLALSGCGSSANYDEVNSHINAHDIELGQGPDTVFDHLGEKPEQEMCLYGYEYTFEDAGLNIGFRLDNDTVRRVTIRNVEDTIYGIHVGDALEDVPDVMEKHGYEKDDNLANRYVHEDLYFTAVSKDGLIIDQLIIEVIDDGVL